MSLPFVGSAFELAVAKASRQSSVNLFLRPMEAAEKAQYILDSVRGLITRWALGGEMRGGYRTGSRAFVVAGATLYELYADYSSVNRGTLATSTGAVSMAYGTTQLVVADGDGAWYVLTLSTNAFQKVTDPDFPGSKTVRFLDNYFLGTALNSQQDFCTKINDATDINALDFASDESQPDLTIGQEVLGREWLHFGTESTESVGNYPDGTSNYPFRRNSNITVNVGTKAPHSIRVLDNGVVFLGQDKRRSDQIYIYRGGAPEIISTAAVSGALAAATDLTQAVAWVEGYGKHEFYGIWAPGMTATWVYDAFMRQWHKRCDLDVNGQPAAYRVTHVFHAFDKTFGGDANGKVYEFSATTYTNAGDALVRERISPHEAIPGRVFMFFSRFFLDCTTGEAAQGDDPQVELSWSRDSAASWSNPVLRSLGKVGERFARLLWEPLGIRARDLLWKVRFSGNAPFAIVDGGGEATKGTN